MDNAGLDSTTMCGELPVQSDDGSNLLVEIENGDAQAIGGTDLRVVETQDSRVESDPGEDTGDVEEVSAEQELLESPRRSHRHKTKPGWMRTGDFYTMSQQPVESDWRARALYLERLVSCICFVFCKLQKYMVRDLLWPF